MALYDLDSLMKGWQSSLKNANNRIEKQQENLLRQVIDVGKSGEPKTLTCVCRMPGGAGRSRDYELLRIPWAGLLKAGSCRISSMSVEFDSEISQKRGTIESDNSVLTFIPVKKDKKTNPNVHHIRLDLKEDDGYQGEILVDKVLFKKAGCSDILIPRDKLECLLATKHGLGRLFKWKWLIIAFLGVLAAVATVWYLDFQVMP